MHDDRVIIVGAGPVGLATALFLVQRGVKVLVLEAEAALSEDMRASTFHPATLDLLAPSGIADALISQGHCANKWQYLNFETGARVVFDLGVLEGMTRYPFRLQCEQFRLTREIVSSLEYNPLFEITFSAPVTSGGQDEAGAWVDVQTGAETKRLRGAYVIAADGGRSVLRKTLDLTFEGETYPKTSITVVVDYDFGARLKDVLFVNYVWTAQDHFSLMRVRDHWRVGFSPQAGQSVEEAVSAEGVNRRLQALFPNNENYKLVHIGWYSVHRRVIDKFNHGRILFAGDAAHLNSPAGGMGMNSGVHDAHELAEQLAAVIAGAPADRLDLYDRRRRTIAVEDVHAQSDRNYRRHREKDPEKRAMIWAELEAITGDVEAMRDYLFRSSMLASLQRAAAIN